MESHHKKSEESLVVLGEFKKHEYRDARIHRLVKKSRDYRILAGLLAVLLFMGGGLYIWHKSQDGNHPALVVGNYSYSKKVYKELVNQAALINVTETDARKALINSLASRSAADGLHVTYPSNQITLNAVARAQYKLTPTATPTKYQQETAFPQLIATYVELAEKGGYEVVVLDLPFSRYINSLPDQEFADGDVKLRHNPDAIKADMQYAQVAAKQYQTKLEQHQNAADLVASIKSDTRLVDGQTGNQSSVMLITDSKTKLDITASSDQMTLIVPELLMKNIRTAAAKPNVPQLSEILSDYAPSDWGVQLPELQRSTGMITGWRLVSVTHRYDKQPDIARSFKQSVEGLKHE